MRQALLRRNRDVSQPTELSASTKSPANQWRAEVLAEQNTDRATEGTLADHATNVAKWSISNINMGSSSQREMGSGAQARVARHEEASTPPNFHRLESYPHRTEIEGALGVQIKGQAVVDPAACDRQHAIAFTEDRVARFSSDQPSLLVAAHEAVHLAQHAGTTRDARLGPEGHAGTVAHLISRGQSVRGLIGSSGDIVPTAVRHYPPAASQKNDVAPSPELLNREQIVDIIRRSRDISEVQAKLGFSMLVSAEALAEYFNKKGVTPADLDQMDEARHDRTPQKVMDEVLVPHDYQENRMVSVAVVGTERQVAQRKAAGQEQARQIVLQGLLASGGAQKGSASNAALADMAVTNRGGIVGTTGRTPTVSSPGTPPPPALPPGPRVAGLLPVSPVAEFNRITGPAAREALPVLATIDPLALPREGTVIPRSFNLNLVDGETVWVSGAATEHFSEAIAGFRDWHESTGRGTTAREAVLRETRPGADDIARGSTTQTFSSQTQIGDQWWNARGPAAETTFASALVLEDFRSAVSQAARTGVPFGKKVVVGNWELILQPADRPGQFAKVTHALPAGRLGLPGKQDIPKASSRP